MKIYLGADHGGFALKEKIKKWFSKWGYEFEDLGNMVFAKEDDYPDFAFKVAEKVAEEFGAMGILACRSGAGMAICANKIKGIRAIVAFDTESAKHSREHNDANVLALSGDFLGPRKIKKILKVWFETPFSAEDRHKRRLEKIKEKESILY